MAKNATPAVEAEVKVAIPVDVDEVAVPCAAGIDRMRSHEGRVAGSAAWQDFSCPLKEPLRPGCVPRQRVARSYGGFHAGLLRRLEPLRTYSPPHQKKRLAQ